MKAALLLTTFRKNAALPNVLTSIAKQKMSTTLEICVLDDCSDVDPEPLVKKYLPSTKKQIVKYKRLKQNAGGRFSKGEAYKMCSPDIDILITMSADIILLESNIFEELYQNTCSKVIPSVTIANTYIKPNFYKHFDRNAEDCLQKWDTYTSLYSGPQRPGFWLFCCAMLKQDFLDLNYDTFTCDRMRQYTLTENGIQMKHLDHLRGLHQSHQTFPHGCNAFDICPGTPAYKTRGPWTPCHPAGSLIDISFGKGKK